MAALPVGTRSPDSHLETVAGAVSISAAISDCDKRARSLIFRALPLLASRRIRASSSAEAMG